MCKNVYETSHERIESRVMKFLPNPKGGLVGDG